MAQMKEVPFEDSQYAKLEFPARPPLAHPAKKWVLDQFEVGVTEIVLFSAFRNRTTRVKSRLGAVMRKNDVRHPVNGLQDVLMILPETPVRLWLRYSEDSSAAAP